ncbi:M56 family metallopeptidase [Lysinibacillus sp. 1 U-2021]|uniref:M56 family metallopeptidase n=1 Tax=unclassified Lysinibacillus TaxID=2636778 RepID=UPI001EDC4758|nr:MULTISPECIES: M56 family metallopeptidase [unclassified Lysinibacillus]UKJ44832.1 M56 family metallopeptidase [Lysinibacillus sp. ACHW1.5]WGT39815.1 M56 family metallopeptidase [Lysinibacillus sp. 1 U-2021]
MHSIMVGLFFKSVVMSFIGLLFIAVTPFLLKRYSARWLYYGWLAILVGFILPFTINISTPVVNLSESVQIPSKEPVPSNSSQITLVSSSVDTVTALSVWQMVMIIWILGIVVFLAVHLVKHYRFMYMVKRWGQTITEPKTLYLLEKVKGEMNITKEIALKECSFIHSPMLVGFTKNTIWLPNNSYREEELNLILKHELVHLKRKDLWYKAFVLLISSIHWFNPLFYLFAKELDNLCEHACDDEVVKNTDIQLRKTYSQTILHAEKLKRGEGVFTTNFLGSTQILKKRILSIMDMSKKKSGIVVMALLILLTTGGMVVSSAFAISSKQLSYLDETFMKESILNGASRGYFATDKFIIYPKNMSDRKTVPPEPTINKELYRDVFSAGVIGTEARYQYPIEIVHRQNGQKYTTVIHIEYDYELLAPVEYDELNTLIEAYLLPFHELKSIPYTDFITPNYLENRLKDYMRDIDTQNTDARVEFTFRFGGWVTNNDHLPFPSQNSIGTTPRYMESTP